MQNLYQQPGLYAFVHPAELPPMHVLKTVVIPKGLVWNARWGVADKATIKKIKEMNQLKKELGQ